jgi:ectoine hydroxylase-related dioxygenase (phytanoyl-CoA dioxygenase family)
MSALNAVGYQVLPALLSTDDVDAMRSAISDGIDRIARGLLTPFDTSGPGLPLEGRLDAVARNDRAYAAALLQAVMADVQHDERIARLQRHPAVLRAVHAAVAPEVPTTFVIRPRAAIHAFMDRISPWHQDVVRPQASNGCARVRVACWIPLADVDADHGALDVLPGRWDGPFAHTVNPHGHFEITDTRLDSRNARAVPMRSGDVLLLDRFVPHRSRLVQEDRGRWAIVMWVKTIEQAGAC